MDIERIREKLGRLIEERGISMRELSLRAGLKHNAVHNIMSRNQRRVNHEFLEKILEQLGTGMAEFWESEPPPREAKSAQKIVPPPGMQQAAQPLSGVMVPDLGSVPAGAFRLPEVESATRFVLGSPEDRHAFALTVAGDSMEPEYREGDMIFLRRENIHLVPLPHGVKVGVPYEALKHLNGKDCVVFMTDEGSAFKRLKIEKGRGPGYSLILLPVNPEHNKTVVRPDHDLWIQGVCYKSIRMR